LNTVLELELLTEVSRPLNPTTGVLWHTPLTGSAS
jgi:hypothetical protein